MKQTILAITLFWTFLAVASDNVCRPKIYECVLETAGILEYATPNDGYENWYPVSRNLMVSGATRLGAMSNLKKECLSLGAVYSLRLTGSSSPAIHFSNRSALLEQTLSICNKLIADSAMCEASSR